MIKLLNQLYRGLTYADITATAESKEQAFRLVFKLLFNLLSFTVYTEVPGGQGRIDAVMLTKRHNYIFEFKVDGKTAADAMDQIITRHYAWFFTGDPKPLHLMGLDFRTECQQIVSFTHQIHGFSEITEYNLHDLCENNSFLTH